MSSDPRLAGFLDQYPQYAATASLDDLRAVDFARLDRGGQTYLDYTGAALYAESQVRDHLALLSGRVLGNPHSANPASLAMTDLVEATRREVLDFFGASEQYHLVFTLNATGALKLVGESFPFVAGGRFLATFDNHNSVNGIREFARGKGARVDYAALTQPDLRLDEDALAAELGKIDRAYPHLFAYPAQSNYSGVKHSLEWVARARALGWKVLLDAAAFAPTNPLDLSRVEADFVSISFYKIFGYPAGLGALLVRKDSLPLLQRPWFSGGTVNFTTVQQEHHILSAGEAAFEDGTINYLSIPAVSIGLHVLQGVGFGPIQTRLQCLGSWLLDELKLLQHRNGRPFVRLHGPDTMDSRGGTFTFNLYDPDGLRIDYRRIEELAGEAGISLRTGCFCNPGANEVAEGLDHNDIAAGLALGADLNLPNFVRLMDEQGSQKSAGAIRVSFGLASNFADVVRFVDFLRPLLNQPRASLGSVSIADDTCRIIRDGS